MITHFEIDANCPHCLQGIIAALRDQPTVTDVRANMAAGCVWVTHDTEESRLARLITDIGHRIVVAGNGEIVQGDLHAVSHPGCPGRR